MMNGLILLDKPTGVSSNAVLQTIKRLLKVKKAGHTGTLDPLASGMLPITLNEATKFSQYLLDADKTYFVAMRLGVRTTTSDAEGEVVATRSTDHLTQHDIETTLSSFVGESQQVPSMFSALKYQGKPLYYYARRGEVIPRDSRTIIIHHIHIMSMPLPDVTFIVRCGKGTYVRTLVDDVGEKLGCGAHVTQLRRLSVAGFSENQMVTVERVSQCAQDNGRRAEPDEPLHEGIPQTTGILKESNGFSDVLSLDAMLQHLPVICVSENGARRLQHGECYKVQNAHGIVGMVRLQRENQQFFGVGECDATGCIIPRRMLRSATIASA